jgi:phosphohistidine phosphatase
MELYFLRHGIAAERRPGSLMDESKRPLTMEGVGKMRRIARGMRRLKLDFDVILASPYLRAKQTAEIAAAALGAKGKLIFSDNLAGHGDSVQLVAELREHHRDCKSLLVVGHEPSMSELISTLLVGNRSLQLVLKKGGLCKLTASELRHGRCAALEWLLTPGQLRRLA